MKHTSDTISKTLNAISDFERLAQELVNKILAETAQKERQEIIDGNLDFIENTSTGELKDNWSYEIHGEHCDFINKTTDQSLTICLGIKSLKFIDPHFFYNFINSTINHKDLASCFPDSFASIHSLFEQMESQGLLKKVQGFGTAFVKK
jgi:hypothetical protein